MDKSKERSDDSERPVEKIENDTLIEKEKAPGQNGDDKKASKQKKPKCPEIGLFIALLSTVFLSLSNVLIKKAKFFSGTEQTTIRYFLQGLIMLCIARYNKLNIFGDKGDRKLLILRGIFGTIGLTTLHLSIKLIDPSDSVALFHTNVIIVAILARFILNEKFSLTHIFSLILAILGVFLISQPSFLFTTSKNSQNTTTTSTVIVTTNLNYTNMTEYEKVNEFKTNHVSLIYILGIVIALTSAFFASGVAILLKKLSNKKVHYSVAIIYASYFGLPFTVSLNIISYLTGLEKKNMQLYDSAEKLSWQIALALMGALCGVVSQILMNVALIYEEASKVSIIRTTDLLFIFILQYVVLDIYSNIFSIVGALMIFVSGILVMIYKIIEKKFNKPARSQVETSQDNIGGKCAACKKIFFYKI